jgi:hypothetical protein
VLSLPGQLNQNEMKTQRILDILVVVVWIAFIGLCIQAGTQLILFGIDLMRTQFLGNVDGSKASVLEHWPNATISILSIVIAALKAYLFYWVIKITTQINIEKPFNPLVGKYIYKMSQIALQIGVLGLIVHVCAKILFKKGLTVPDYGSGHEYLFFAGILYLIAQIYRRGIALQRENELTV